MASSDKGSDKGPGQSTPESPHDKLVKRVFGRPEHAASHLRTILPSKLAERVAWDTLKPEPGSYVGSNMRYLHTDSLFSAKLNDGSDRLVLFYLFEHQSTPDQLMAARLYGYTGQAVLSWLRRQTPTPKRIPAVLSLVLYDGKLTWTPPMDLIELFDLPEELREVCRPYLPSFRYILHDLWREQDADLRARPLSALILLTFAVPQARSQQPGPGGPPDRLAGLVSARLRRAQRPRNPTVFDALPAGGEQARNHRRSEARARSCVR